VTNNGVSFPLATKAEVQGSAARPLYNWAALERPGETARWNLHKFLVGRDGRIAAVLSSQIEPSDPGLVAAIEKSGALSGEKRQFCTRQSVRWLVHASWDLLALGCVAGRDNVWRP
jgi:hypothetical protein